MDENGFRALGGLTPFVTAAMRRKSASIRFLQDQNGRNRVCFFYHPMKYKDDLYSPANINRAEAAFPPRSSLSVLEASSLTLLVIEDDLPVLNACSDVARNVGFKVLSASTAEEARDYVATRAPDLILMDLKMPGGGLPLLRDIRADRPRASVVVMTAYATVASAVDAMRMGATDYLTKPFAMDELITVLEHAARTRNQELESRRMQGRAKAESGAPLLSNSPEFEKLLRIVRKVAGASHPVLILGESGSGKETIARAIHASGPNAGRPFRTVECNQLSPAVLEAELFGAAEKELSSSPGTSRIEPAGKPGLLVSDDGGTLFLDQIGEMPLDLQAKLLRVLQNRSHKDPRTGEIKPLTMRILASSTRNVAAMVEQGAFRKDLYYRLNVVSLRIPPLRERGHDVLLLAEHFLQRARRERGVPYRFAADALQAIQDYDWPGNVRELETSIERACTLSSGHVLHMGDMPTQLHHTAALHGGVSVLRVDERVEVESSPVTPRVPQTIVSIAELEREAILHTIKQLNGDKLMAAKLLGIGKTTLYRKLKEYGITDV